MKKTFEIEVDCANCAQLMEQAASKVAGVASVTVNFMEDGVDVKSVMKTVLSECKKVEPDCEISL